MSGPVAPEARAKPSMRVAVQSLGRALRHKNYRLFFIGQSISLIGSWITRVATSWLVYRLEGSVLQLGLVGFAGQIPTFLIAPLAGVWVDRWNRHRVLVVTQILAMIQSALLAVLAFSGHVTIGRLIALAVFQGVINAFDLTARQAFVVEMVDKREDLPNAIALNSTMFNAARLIGPSIAGILIAAFGEAWCFAIDAVTYLAVIGTLLAMRLGQRAPHREHAGVFTELRAGVLYAAKFAPIRAILLLVAVASFLGMPYTVLMPVIVKTTLHGDAHTYGFLLAAAGLGALIGALRLASRKSVLGLGRVIVFSAGMFGLALVGFALSHTIWLSMVLLVVAGMSMITQLAASNTILQTIVDEDKRGRVMSLYTTAVFGAMPFGSMLAGVLADRIGTEKTILCGGIGCVVGALLFGRQLPEMRALVRPIYQRLGILPEVASGIETASELKQMQ